MVAPWTEMDFTSNLEHNANVWKETGVPVVTSTQSHPEDANSARKSPGTGDLFAAT